MRGRKTHTLLRFGQLGAFCLVLATNGCASDWLTTLRNEPLPIEGPSPYPTAVQTREAESAEVATIGGASANEGETQPLPAPLPTNRAAKPTLAIAPHRVGRPPPPVPVDLTHLKKAKEKEQASRKAAAEEQASQPGVAADASPAEQATPEQDDQTGSPQAAASAATPQAAAKSTAPPTAAPSIVTQGMPHPAPAPVDPVPEVSASPRPTDVAQTAQISPVGGAQPANLANLIAASNDVATAGAASDSAPVEPHFDVPTLSPEERLAAMAAQRDVLIAMLEEEIQLRRINATPDSELTRLEQQLRLLYAAAERVDDAVRGIDALPTSEREAFKHTMFGVSTWLSEAESRKSPLRNARALRSLREATTQLSAVSKLDLKNLALCERVESFGWFTEFPRYEFDPKQQVILYVEVDNFVAIEKSPNSFETELQGHYQIFDARGNIVAERKLPLDRELCRNYRRDYFLAYPIYMPDQIESGKYRLELTIEDLKAEGEYQGRKFGEGMIEFTIRG